MGIGGRAGLPPDLIGSILGAEGVGRHLKVGRGGGQLISSDLHFQTCLLAAWDAGGWEIREEAGAAEGAGVRWWEALARRGS